MGAKFELDTVQQKVSSWKGGNKNAGWFSMPNCSVDYVIHIFECSQAEAEEIIFDGLLRLEEDDFCRSIVIFDSELADEYGLENYLGHNWYIKFMIGSDGELEELSFHPCERDMKLENGRTLNISINEIDLPSWRKK